MSTEESVLNFVPNPELLESWEAESENPGSQAEPNDQNNDQNSEVSPGFKQESNSETAKPSPEPRKLKIMVTASPKDVKDYILTQYSLGFAEVYEWSKPQPTGVPGEVISILIR